MDAITEDRPHAGRANQTEGKSSVGALFPDPLDMDQPGDDIVLTTRRAIGRVALVATETASRFQREALPQDPMAWLFAPRRVFDGGSAIDACLDRDACMRGVLVHGLGLGLDVDRAVIDALLAHDDDAFEEREFEYLYGERMNGSGQTGRQKFGRVTRLRLYTATIVETRDNRMVQAFHASLARNKAEVRARLAGRFGPDLADAADIRTGLHTTSPLVIALVPSAVAAMIVRIARDGSTPAARTFAVDIQQCIQA
jgi:hypothetical protein